MHRREFVLNGMKVSLAFLALDSLPVSAFAQAIDWKAIPASLDDSLEVLAAYLTKYIPPTGNFPSTGAWKAGYDLIEWTGTPGGGEGRHPIVNRALGQLTFTRHPVESGMITYDLDYTIRLYGWESGLKSTMQCTADRIPALVSWQTDYENHPLKLAYPPVTLSEQGQCRDGELVITSKLSTRRFQTTRPVVPQWAVIDALRTAKADPSDPIVGAEYDLLFDLTSYRPRQKLKPCGTLDMNIGGQDYQLHGFVQTGIAGEPTHYWIDSAGRPLLITGGLLSSALTSVEPA